MITMSIDTDMSDLNNSFLPISYPYDIFSRIYMLCVRCLNLTTEKATTFTVVPAVISTCPLLLKIQHGGTFGVIILYSSQKQLPRKMKSRLVIIECAGYIFGQSFLGTLGVIIIVTLTGV